MELNYAFLRATDKELKTLIEYLDTHPLSDPFEIRAATKMTPLQFYSCLYVLDNMGLIDWMPGNMERYILKHGDAPSFKAITRGA